MSTNDIIIILAAIGAALGGTYVLAYFKGSKKSANIDNVVKEIDTLSPLLAPVVTYVENRLPEPIRSYAKQITAGIGDAVTAAENGWKSGLLTTESRKDFALNATNAVLLKLNIKPTDATATVISKAIDLAVGLFLPISETASAQSAQDASMPTDTATAQTAPDATTSAQTAGAAQ